MFIEQELADATIPGADVGEELLKAFDTAIGEGDKGEVGTIVDLDHLTIVDVVRI